MSVRSGGLWVGALEGPGSRTLSQALDLYPGARIDVAARHADLSWCMQRAAYLVMPGHGEDDAELKPMMLAFAQALPVIASRTPAFAEHVEPGRNGLLFDPGSARDLARRLAWADAFPERMRQMGQCAQADYNARFVADWNWQRLYGERRRQARLNP